MPPHTWIEPTGAALDRLSAHPRTSALLWHAFTSVEGLHYAVDLDAAAVAARFIGHNMYVADLAHARWACGTAVTAIDLCAAIGARLLKLPTLRKGFEYDLPEFSRRIDRHTFTNAQHRLAITWWTHSVSDDHAYRTIKRIRNDLIHGYTPRQLDGHSRTRFEFRGESISVPELLAALRDVATNQVSAFLFVINNELLIAA